MQCCTLSCVALPQLLLPAQLEHGNQATGRDHQTAALYFALQPWIPAPSVQVVAQDGNGCVCAPGFRRTFPNANFGATQLGVCEACPEASSADGLRCVSCDASSGPDHRAATLAQSRCVCSSNDDNRGVVTEVLQNGQLLQDDLGQYLARCIVCNNTAIPDPATGTCVQCSYPQVVDDDGQCACPAVMPEGARCSNLDPLQRIANTLGVSLPGSLYSASVLITTDEGTETSTFVSDSAPLVELLEPSAAGCFDSGDRRACNALANLCVLERYTRCFALPLCTPIVLFAAKPAVPSNLCLFLTTKEPMSFSYNEATYVFFLQRSNLCVL